MNSRIYRLVAVAVVVVLLPILLLAYVVLTISQSAVRDEASTHLTSVSSTSSALLFEQMNSIVRMAEATATNPRIVEAAINKDYAALEEDLKSLVASQSDIPISAITDLDGLFLVAPGNNQLIGQSIAFRDWFQGLKRRGTTYVSEAVQGVASTRPLGVSVATYIRSVSTDGNRTLGDPIATLMIAISLNKLQSFATQISSDTDSDVWFVDQSNTILATPEGNPGGLFKIDTTELAPAANISEGVVHERTLGKVPVLVVKSGTGNLGWSVYVVEPRSEAYAAANRLRDITLAITIPLAIIVAVGMFFFVRLQLLQQRTEKQLKSSREGARSVVEVLGSQVKALLNNIIEQSDFLSGTDLSVSQRRSNSVIKESSVGLLELVDGVIEVGREQQ